MAGLRRVVVDFNERFENEWLLARITDLDPPAHAGEQIIVYEPADIRARARVAKLDAAKDLMYLDADWDSIESEEDLPTEPSSQRA